MPLLDPCEDFEVYACGPRDGWSRLRRPGDLAGAGATGRLFDEMLAGRHAADFPESSMLHRLPT